MSAMPCSVNRFYSKWAQPAGFVSRTSLILVGLPRSPYHN
ncbi:hypothetical protein VCHC43B1_0472 [Vibrio cholerae HC-43B1]|nr:hypothetical protein VCHC43B1_0472 [Vibrio cholerae HC-43B1]